MADLTTDVDAPSRSRLLRSWQASPIAVRIGIIYVASRLITSGFFLLAAGLSTPNSRFGENPTLAELSLGWDAQWYWFVAVHGYPSTLPLTDSGQIAENQWAFMPIYSYLSQWIGLPLGSWGAGAVVVSLVAGYLAALVLYRMLHARLGDAASVWAVVFFASAPLAALFQVGYAESLFLLWLFLAIWMVMRRSYAWLYLLIPLMGFTRPGVLAFALFLGLHGIQRWFDRRNERLPVSHIVHIVATGLLTVVVGFSWQVIAGIVTRDPGAYLATELAWRRNWISGGDEVFVPFDGFVRAAAFWFETWGLGAVTGYVFLGLVIVGLAALLLFEPHVRRLGPDIRLWSASYLVYLLLVFFPQSSIFRLLVPLSPLWGAAAAPRSTPWRIGVLAACLLGQWWWIYNMYALGNAFWQIP